MRYVIVGASAAGLAAARTVREADPAAEVLLLSEERDPPYCRPLISYWLAGETPEKLLPMRVAEGVELRLSARAATLDADRKRVHLTSGQELAYDRLLLATGASSARLGVGGEDLPNVRALRTLDDARALDADLRAGAARALVLGGGLVGVKAAQALARRGASVALCMGSAHPLSQVVDEAAGTLVADALAEEGVEVLSGLAPVQVAERGGRAVGVTFAGDTSPRPCDLAVVGKGVVPRSELARGPRCDARVGIPVDGGLRTPLPDVWAAGDAALAFDAAWGRPRVNAIWPMAVEQGELAGRNMAGAAETYAGAVGMNSLRVGSLELVSAGVTRPPDPSYEVRAELDRARRRYRKLVLRDGRVVGMVFAGAADQAGLLVSAVRRGARLDELPFDPLAPGIHWGRYAFAEKRP